jgi:hypothetical protein
MTLNLAELKAELEEDRYRYRVQPIKLASCNALVIARPDGWWIVTDASTITLHTGADNGTIGAPVFAAALDLAYSAGDLAAAVDNLVHTPAEHREHVAALEGPNTAETPTLAKHLTSGSQVEFATDDGMVAGTVVEAYGNGHGGINLKIRTVDGVTHKRCWHRLEEIGA